MAPLARTTAQLALALPPQCLAETTVPLSILQGQTPKSSPRFMLSFPTEDASPQGASPASTSSPHPGEAQSLVATHSSPGKLLHHCGQMCPSGGTALHNADHSDPGYWELCTHRDFHLSRHQIFLDVVRALQIIGKAC